MIRFEEVPALLADLLERPLPPGWPRGEVGSVEQDSRRIRPPGLFVCVAGTHEDGRRFLDDAARRGAAAAIGPATEVEEAAPPVPYAAVRDPRRASAILSARHHGDPSHFLDLIGITGTNGKTTTSWLLQAIWEGCGLPAAVSGTLGAGRPGALRAATHTTPEAPRFQASLRELLAEGYRAVAAEVSSHALDQDRVYATRFRAAVFTNLTRDHLDYHGTLDAYAAAKAKLFHPEGRGDASPCIAVMNLDDAASSKLRAGSPDPLFGYGTRPACAIRLESLEATPEGLRLRVLTPRGARTVRSPLIGTFNGWNLLAAYATAWACGLPPDAVEERLARGVRVPGRMERIERGQPFLVVVDYAHTPDALARAIEALRPQTRGRLTVLFGCGGDRDHGKRPEMGRIAAERADRVIVTSDNPRSEDPRSILEAIVEGVREAGREPDLVTLDREEAIFAAVAGAGSQDALLIAGKGHEDYQETAQGKRPFDDREVAARALASQGWGP